MALTRVYPPSGMPTRGYGPPSGIGPPLPINPGGTPGGGYTGVFGNLAALNAARAARGLPAMGQSPFSGYTGPPSGSGVTPGGMAYGEGPTHMGVRYGGTGTVGQPGAVPPPGLNTGAANANWLRYLTGGYTDLPGTLNAQAQAAGADPLGTLNYLRGYYRQMNAGL